MQYKKQTHAIKNTTREIFKYLKTYLICTKCIYVPESDEWFFKSESDDYATF